MHQRFILNLMKTTTNKWALRNKYTHEIVNLVPHTKAAALRIIKATGRTDLEVTQVNW